MRTPFPSEELADKNTFYGRSSEISKVKKFIENSKNLLIFSKRRMGKTTLVKKVFSEIEKDVICIYADVYGITSKKEFAQTLIDALVVAQKGDYKAILKRLGKMFSKTRFIPKIDPTTLVTSFTIDSVSSSYEELIQDFFEAIFKLSETKDVALAIDEFQQISTLKDAKIDAHIRKYIQEPHNISYIFLGSKRHTLNDLFKYQSPLYEMATPMNLENIDVKDSYEYVQKHLKINEDNLAYVFELANGETKLTQHILSNLYTDYKMRKEIDREMIDKALREVLIEKSETYKIIYNEFSINQKKAFKLLTKYEKKLSSAKILQEQEISRASMQSALSQLFDKEFIDKEPTDNNEDVWFVPDRAFELWAKLVLN